MKSFRKRFIKTEFLYILPFILIFIIAFPSTLAQEIESNEIIPHRDLAISYIIGRDGSITAQVEDDSFTVTIPQIANQFWLSVQKTIIDENITTIEYIKGANTVLLTLNLTENVLHFDLSGKLVDENLLVFKFSENTKRLSENRTGLRLANGNEFYFDWEDINPNLQREYIAGSKSLRVDIRSAPNFKIDPRISINNPDFETGDFTGYATDGCGIDSNDLVNSTQPINGTYSYHVIIGSGADNNCSRRQDIGGHNDNYVQFQIDFKSAVAWTDGDIINFHRLADGGSLRTSISIQQNDTAGGFQWRVSFDGDGGDTIVNNASFPLITIGSRYCVEYHYLRSASANSGIGELWINKTQFTSNSGIDNNGRGQPDRLYVGNPVDGSGGPVTFKVDDLYADSSERVNTCPEGLIPPVPPPISIIVVDFFPLAPLMNLFFIVGGFILVFSAKGRLEFQATGMFFFLASLLFVSVPIYAIIDDTSSLSYVILNYPDAIRNNFVLINFVFIGLGLTSVIINNKGRLGFR